MILLFIKICIAYNLPAAFSVLVTKYTGDPYMYNESEIKTM
jgi:hypothetical protein